MSENIKNNTEIGRRAEVKGSYLLNKISVCVDEVADGIVKGRVFHHEIDHVVSFADVDQLLLRMESFLDERNYPAASTESRYFIPPNKQTTIAEDEEIMKNKSHGEKATFVIQVQYRQNATWQGYVTWLETDKKQPFRSALELIKLLDSSANAAEQEDAESGHPTAQ